MNNIIGEIADTAMATIDKLTDSLPDDFPVDIHDSIMAAVKDRIGRLTIQET